jgi:hypothetical protein
MSEARTSEGARVIGAGVPVAIAGEEHRLLFDFEALETIEDQFDGLLQFTLALNGGYRTKRFKSIRVGLQAGLAHEDLTPENLQKLTADLQASLRNGFEVCDAVHKAICEAFDQAIPPPKKDKRSSKGSARVSVSRGPASTAAMSSSSALSPQASAA